MITGSQNKPSFGAVFVKFQLQDQKKVSDQLKKQQKKYNKEYAVTKSLNRTGFCVFKLKTR